MLSKRTLTPVGWIDRLSCHAEAGEEGISRAASLGKGNQSATISETADHYGNDDEEDRSSHPTA